MKLKESSLKLNRINIAEGNLFSYARLIYFTLFHDNKSYSSAILTSPTLLRAFSFDNKLLR